MGRERLARGCAGEAQVEKDVLEERTWLERLLGRKRKKKAGPRTVEGLGERVVRESEDWSCVKWDE